MEWREIAKKGSVAVSTAVKRGLNMQPRKWIVVNNSARLEEKRAHQAKLQEQELYEVNLKDDVGKAKFVYSMK